MYGADVSSQVAAFAAFTVVAALLTVTPGVDTLLVLRTTVSADRRTGLVTAAGVLTGILVWASAAGLGVAALLATSPTAYAVLKVVGAVYLAGLGGRLLWRAQRRRVQRGIDRVTGIVFLGFAARLALSQRP